MSLSDAYGLLVAAPPRGILRSQRREEAVMAVIGVWLAAGHSRDGHLQMLDPNSHVVPQQVEGHFELSVFAQRIRKRPMDVSSANELSCSSQRLSFL